MRLDSIAFIGIVQVPLLPFIDSEVKVPSKVVLVLSCSLTMSTVTLEMVPSSFQVPVMAKLSRITASAGGFEISRDGASVST